MRTRLICLLLLASWGAAFLSAESSPSPALLVLSKSDHTLAIVDPATLKVLARVPSGPKSSEQMSV